VPLLKLIGSVVAEAARQQLCMSTASCKNKVHFINLMANPVSRLTCGSMSIELSGIVALVHDGSFINAFFAYSDSNSPENSGGNHHFSKPTHQKR
jgi:hypothetical protein